MIKLRGFLGCRFRSRIQMLMLTGPTSLCGDVAGSCLIRIWIKSEYGLICQERICRSGRFFFCSPHLPCTDKEKLQPHAATSRGLMTFLSADFQGIHVCSGCRILFFTRLQAETALDQHSLQICQEQTLSARQIHCIRNNPCGDAEKPSSQIKLQKPEKFL